MLDPLTALQTASAVVQLIDFSIKIAGSAYEIYQDTDGATQANIHLKGVATHLQSLCDKVSNATNATGGRSSNNGDTRLLDIASKCHDVAQDILQLLNTLHIDKSLPFQSWQALRMALRTHRKADKLDALHRRMDGLRGELTLHLVYMMK